MLLYERLLKELRIAKNNVENIVLHSQIQDFNTYKFLLGQIKGLQDSIDICETNYKVDSDD